MSRIQNKASRLSQIEAILLAHPQGVTQADLARQLQVDRSTINRDLVDLPKHIYIDDLDGGRLKIDHETYLVNVRLNLHEALAVHLAARLLATRMERQNRHAAGALRKLGLALEQLAPQISLHLQQSADVMDAPTRHQDPRYLGVLEKLTVAWAEKRKVQVWHRHENGQVIEYIFAPYFIEPYAVGQSTHVIGLRQPPGAMRTFKIERIERVELLRDPYTIPSDFDPRTLLSDAWGIWYTDHEPVEVVLKFGARVAQRVGETRWHRSEQTSLEPDGSLLWRAMVAEPQEMLNWVRGWGAAVEVIEPESLRESVKREVLKMARLYGLETSGSIPKYFLLWAKSEKNQIPDLHPLIYHMLDVGESTLALWNHGLSVQTRTMLAQWIGLDIETAGRQLAFWASLHDLGKAAPGFQRKYPAVVPALKAAGFTFPLESPRPAPHGIISAWALNDLLKEIGLKPQDATSIAYALGGHHGAWPTDDLFSSIRLKASDRGDDAIWMNTRKELFEVLKTIYQPADSVKLPANPDELNAFLTLFSGLVSIADWIGSMSENFPFVEGDFSAKDYAGQASKKAKAALEKLGWLGWQTTGQLLPFAAMFPATPTPNPIQTATFAAADRKELPALVILEAPTGTGKTEAALFLADTWLQKQAGKGVYIAMPSQATSNQMYERVGKFLMGRYPNESINLHLVHGAAMLREEENAQPQGIAQDENSLEGTVKAESWFLPRKRTLLAPFGVGTVDQALLSVLQTRHFFVRMFGLAQKVVVFDEVHAYDTYMSTLFERLLRWLRSIGTSVILLSATLPEQTRRSLVSAWLGAGAANLPPAGYPRLTVVSAGQVETQPLPAPPSRTVFLNWAEPEPQAIAVHLADRLKEGGCAAVICNRVHRAQEIYQAIKDQEMVEPQHLILFHARFPFAWRDEIEKRVLALFSKGGDRPHKAIVVATQVIEQSLDLDFDYMLTDLAPIDLLLQRAGRLHRHSQNDANRPPALAKPCLTIVRSPIKDELPDFGLDGRIYDQATLLCTWLALQGRENLILPDQTTRLIESVYGEVEIADLPANLAQTLKKAKEKARIDLETDISKAKVRLIAKPNDKGLFADHNEKLEEEDTKISEAFRALTRLGDPTISIICLHQTQQGIALEPDGTGAPVDIQKRPTITQAKQLLRHAVNVQRKDVVSYILNHDGRKSDWKRSAAVREHYPVVFDSDGLYGPADADFILKLTREFGLEVLKKE